MKLDLTSLEKALATLDRGLARATAAPEDEELRDTCIQRFEFTFELCWKMLKRRLAMDWPNAAEIDAMSYRMLIRVGAEQGLIDDVPAWFVYRDKCNLTSHTYDAETAADGFPVPARHCRTRARSSGVSAPAGGQRCLTSAPDNSGNCAPF